jgi:site-specific DNA-cytosine methylase
MGMAGGKTHNKTAPFAPGVIDRFCGAGGISCGFRDAGFTVLAGIDNREDALVTYRHNFPDTKTINADIENIMAKELWETRKVHIAWTRMNSARPCFTIDTGHNHHFHLNKNEKTAIEFIAKNYNVNPMFDVYIHDLSTKQGKKKFEIQWGIEFARGGDNDHIFKTSTYGVPQKRERIIIVGVADNIKTEFKFSPKTTEDDKVPLSVAVSKVDKELYRRFTPREAARIQSFPDTFEFAGSELDAYKQIGNAIPPVMFWHIGKSISNIFSSGITEN